MANKAKVTDVQFQKNLDKILNRIRTKAIACHRTLKKQHQCFIKNPEGENNISETFTAFENFIRYDARFGIFKATVGIYSVSGQWYPILLWVFFNQ